MAKKKTTKVESKESVKEETVEVSKKDESTTKPAKKKVVKKKEPTVKPINVDLFEVWYGANEPMKHHIDLAKKLLNECNTSMRVSVFRRNNGFTDASNCKEVCRKIWDTYK